MDLIKIGAIKEWPTPRNILEIQSFLGFINFYYRFIKNYLQITADLTNFTKKECEWV